MGATSTLTVRPIQGEWANFKFQLDQDGRSYEEEDETLCIDAPNLQPRTIANQYRRFIKRAEILSHSSTTDTAVVEVFDIQGQTEPDLDDLQVDTAKAHGFEAQYVVYDDLDQRV